MEYKGSCHCGNVQYKASMNIETVMSCNCSICSRKGHLLTFIPQSAFQLIKGEDSLTDYQFNKKQIHHLFCKKCGVSSFARGAMPDGSPIIAVNARCLEGVDLEKIPVKKVDGKSF